MLLNGAKCQAYSFYRFWVIKSKPKGSVKLLPHTQIRVERGTTGGEDFWAGRSDPYCSNHQYSTRGKTLY